MPDVQEKWYQATMWLWACGAQRDRFVRLGPPRRLIADVLLDLHRHLETAREEYADPAYFRKDGGAIELWPAEEFKWIDMEKLRALEPA